MPDIYIYPACVDAIRILQTRRIIRIIMDPHVDRVDIIL
jgi:hypothetical protein